MKCRKIMGLISLLVIFSLLLCGCNTDEPPINEPTEIKEEKLFKSVLEYSMTDEFGICAVLTMQIATTNKIPVDFSYQVKLGVINLYFECEEVYRYIYAEGFEYSTPFKSNETDSSRVVYYNYNKEPFLMNSKDVDVTTQGEYTELLTFKLCDTTPRVGYILVEIQTFPDSPQGVNTMWIYLDYATDGEYIAFSLESQEAAQAMLEK